MTMLVKVRPDCKIAFPIVDEIDVNNLTTEALNEICLLLNVSLGDLVAE